VPAVSPEVLAYLMGLEWPGNIRELENVARRFVLLGVPAALDELRRRARPSAPASSAPAAPAAAASAGGEVRPLKDVVRDATRQAILDALAATGGSRTEAARRLGVSRKTLFNKMTELGVKEESSWS
jgi:two-component system response regulator AtoC